MPERNSAHGADDQRIQTRFHLMLPGQTKTRQAKKVLETYFKDDTGESVTTGNRETKLKLEIAEVFDDDLCLKGTTGEVIIACYIDVGKKNYFQNKKC